MINVFNFSGGLSSAYMTLRYYKKGDLVIFCDTGREHPKTYKFINDFEAFESIPIIRLCMDNSEDAFRALILKRKSFKIPAMNMRFCTEHLKIRTAKRYLSKNKIYKFNNFIGFRADEERRVLERKQNFKKVFDKFPLYDNGINKQFINEFWLSKPYRLEIPHILGNCTLCFMKGKNAIINILSSYPELAAPWIEDERLANLGSVRKKRSFYFDDVSIETLLNFAKNNLFSKTSLVDINPAFNCSCNSF